MEVEKVDKRNEYKRYAEHCLEMVKTARDQESRIILREMAATWLNLAEKPER